MCTYLNGRLTAFTGVLPSNLLEGPAEETCSAPHLEEKQPAFHSGEREQIRFDENGRDYKGSRYECSPHNRGRKPRYKNKHST